jgi:hypothetical protein
MSRENSSQKPEKKKKKLLKKPIHSPSIWFPKLHEDESRNGLKAVTKPKDDAL